MTKLDCNVASCMYNKEDCCMRNNIEIEGDNARYASETCCGSFAQGKEKNGCCSDCGKPSKDTDVCCDAVECKFNMSHKCSADHIGISGKYAGDMKETECASFAR